MSTSLTQPALKPVNNGPIVRSRTFTLHYHFRNQSPLTLVFELDGDLKAAIDRGILHCKAMNYKFIKVRPFIVDLDEREKRRNDMEDTYVDYS